MVLGVSSAALAPIIGVLTVPVEYSENCDTLATATATLSPLSCFNAVYVKWIESAGGRVAPLPYNADVDTLESLFTSVNGVLFTGGSVDLSGESSAEAQLYMQTASLLFNKTLDAENVPLWGTCMGFQTLGVLVGGIDALEIDAFDSEGMSLPLNLTTAAATSRLFGSMPDAIVDILTTQNVTTNLHHDGLSWGSWGRQLDRFFAVLSTNSDRRGRIFLSTMEAKRYPIYATQWHPERPQFEFKLAAPQGADENSIDHSPSAILAMQYVASFFVQQCRALNSRAFPSLQAEDEALVYNTAPIGSTSDSLAYVFDAGALAVAQV